MRYTHTLAALIIAATATWIWAEPSQEVQLPNQPMAAQLAPAAEAPNSLPRIDGEVAAIGETPRLGLVVTPGDNLQTTIFDVTLRASSDFAVLGDSNATFSVSVSPDAQSLSTVKVQLVGPNHWRFRGADLASTSQDKSLPKLRDAASISVSALVRDGKQSPFSRGANILTVESEPVPLTLR